MFVNNESMKLVLPTFWSCMISQQQRDSSQHAQSLPCHDVHAVLHFTVEKHATGSALPLTLIAIPLDTLQEMCKDEQHTQRQIVHLNTEINELATWMQNIARMAHVLAAAGELGPLKAPERGDFSPDNAPRANPQLETTGVSAGLWGPLGVSRTVGEWVACLAQSTLRWF